MSWTKKEAYNYGHKRGEQAAEVATSTFWDWAPNSTKWKPRYHSLKHLPLDLACELIETEAHFSEINSRQFASFTNGFAAEVNRLPEEEQEELWDRFEEGVSSGIAGALPSTTNVLGEEE